MVASFVIPHTKTISSRCVSGRWGNAANRQEGERQLQEYFRGERQKFELPLDAAGTPFQLKVWEALRQIPCGETRSYKDIAIAVENPKGVRAIGMANNRNPISIITPCHRVIGTNGKLVGYAGGLHLKEYLLNHETKVAIEKG